MIYIETGSTDVYYNFGLEYYFSAEKDLGDTVFLFWQTTPTLMIGKYQNVLEEIDRSYAQTHGIALVRRMSGGGTIYTDPGGFQYTFIQHKDAREIEFDEYIRPVIGALRRLGAQVEFNGRNDLTIGGKKISGTAQYRTPRSLVHHGSLLYDTDIRALETAITVEENKIASKSIRSVRDRVTNIADHLVEAMSREEFKKCMVASILQAHGENVETYELTADDDARIRTLAQEKFAGWENIYGSNPAFNVKKTGYFPGGKIQFLLSVDKGIIRSAELHGDFFSLAAEAVAQAITGCRYEKKEVLDALLTHGLEGAVYRLSAADMAALIVD